MHVLKQKGDFSSSFLKDESKTISKHHINCRFCKLSTAILTKHMQNKRKYFIRTFTLKILSKFICTLSQSNLMKTLVSSNIPMVSNLLGNIHFFHYIFDERKGKPILCLDKRLSFIYTSSHQFDTCTYNRHKIDALRVLATIYH